MQTSLMLTFWFLYPAARAESTEPLQGIRYLYNVYKNTCNYIAMIIALVADKLERWRKKVTQNKIKLQLKLTEIITT